MAVSLSKGQKVDLTKANPGLTSIIVGLGWDASLARGLDYDLDASAFLLGGDGRVTSDLDFVFYNNPQGAGGSVLYTGDNKTGIGNYDDEQIIVDLSRVPHHIQRVAFTITIHDGERKGQTFGQIRNAYVRVYNQQTGQELIQYNLGTNFQVETAIVAAEVYRYNGEWKFSATGSGFRGGLAALCNNFGIQVEQEPPMMSSVPPAYNTQPHYQQQPPYQQQSYGEHAATVQPSYSQAPSYGQVSQSATNPYAQQSYVQMGQPPVNSYAQQSYQHGQGHHNSQAGGYPSHGISCTKCASPNVSVGKKGFGIGKAAIGGLIFGPVGLLGGFMGGNKLKITCLDCGYSYEPRSSEMSRMMSELKHQAKQLLNQYKSAEVLDAIVASLAMVATADGHISPAERNKVYDFIHQNEELRVFNTTNVISRFDYFTNQLVGGHYSSRAVVLQAVGKARYKSGLPQLIVRYCIALAYADGHFAPQEQQVIEEICRELGLNPREFLY